MTDLDVLRVAKNCTLNLENIREERGGFWVIEYENGKTNWLNGKPAFPSKLKSYHYCDDVIKAQDEWLKGNDSNE